MPAHVQPSKFTVTFWRDHNEPHDARVAATGEDATMIAITLLIDNKPLQHGDKLTVRED